MQVRLVARHSDSLGALQFPVDSVRAHFPFIRLRAQHRRTILVGEIFAVHHGVISIVVDEVLGAGPGGHVRNPAGRTPADL
jgi:hypothetical protein